MFRLEKYVFPILGDKHINRIEPRDVLALVRPIDQQGHNETARRLRISLVTLTDWVNHGKIRAHKIGGRVLFRDSDVEAALNRIVPIK